MFESSGIASRDNAWSSTECQTGHFGGNWGILIMVWVLGEIPQKWKGGAY